MKTKILIFVLVISVAAPFLFSCKKGNNNRSEETDNKNFESFKYDTLAESNYDEESESLLSQIQCDDLGGKSVVIAHKNTEIMIPQEDVSSLESKAKLQAIQKSQNKLNCKIEETIYLGSDELLSNLRTNSAAGLPYCDIAMVQYNSIGGHIYHSTLCNLERIDNLKLTEKYFNQKSLDCNKIGGTAYAVYGSFSEDIRDDYAVFYKKNENSDELYRHALAGTLTWENLFNYYKSQNSDVSIKIANYDGYNEFADVFYASSGEHFVLSDESGALNNYVSSEKNRDMAWYINRFYKSRNVLGADDGLKSFTNDSTQILIASLDTMRHFTNISPAWGILPIPKYSESQANYSSMAPYSCFLMAIPKADSVDPSVSADVMNVLNAASYGIVKDAVLTEYIRFNIRDNGTISMFQLITDSLNFDFAFATGEAYSGIAKGTYRLFRLCSQNGYDITEYYGARANSVQYDFNKLLQTYGTNN